MSRSRRKTPISGVTTAVSDHCWKKMASRKLRHRAKQSLNTTLDGDRFAGKRWDLVNPWSSQKDGKNTGRAPIRRGCESSVAKAAYAIAYNGETRQLRGMKRTLISMLCLIAAACGDNDRDDRSLRVALPEEGASAAFRATRAGSAGTPPVPAVWNYDTSAHAARYGPPGASPLLSISCEGWDQRAARLVIVRYAAADRGAEALFAIQGSKGILRLPVGAVKVGQQGYVWRGGLDAGDPRAEVLLGSGLKATVPGGGELDLPPMGAAGAVVSECVLRPTRDERQAVAQTLPNLASNPETSPADR